MLRTINSKLTLQRVLPTRHPGNWISSFATTLTTLPVAPRTSLLHTGIHTPHHQVQRCSIQIRTLTMKAARYYGKEDIRIEQVPEPGPPKAGEVKIRPSFVGICGTDLHEYLGGPTFCPAASRPHPITGETVPVTLGHEFSGVITEIGPGTPTTTTTTTALRPGQHVAVQPTLYCGECAACRSGAENACHRGGFVGLSGSGGGLSGGVVVAADRVFPLPEGLGLEIGALVEPLAVGWHAVSAAAGPGAGPGLGRSALVLGGGPIGLAVIQCLRARGVDRVMVAEPAAQRQRFAREFGASDVINPVEEDVTEKVMELTGGVGADVVFDCAGVPASIKSACSAVKVRGTIVNVAIWEKEIPFNPNWTTFKESTFKSVLGYQKADFEAVIENLRIGTLKPESMITRKIKLDDLVEKGIRALITDKENQVKVLVDMTEG